MIDPARLKFTISLDGVPVVEAGGQIRRLPQFQKVDDALTRLDKETLYLTVILAARKLLERGAIETELKRIADSRDS